MLGSFKAFRERAMFAVGWGHLVPTPVSLWQIASTFQQHTIWAFDPEMDEWLLKNAGGRVRFIHPSDWSIMTGTVPVFHGSGVRFERLADAIMFRLAFGERLSFGEED